MLVRSGSKARFIGDRWWLRQADAVAAEIRKLALQHERSACGDIERPCDSNFRATKESIGFAARAPIRGVAGG